MRSTIAAVVTNFLFNQRGFAMTSVAEKKRKKRGRPPVQGQRTPTGRLSRAKPVEFVPIPEQVRRGLGDGLGGIDDPVSRLQRLKLITDQERKVADAIEALYISASMALGLPRMTGSALEPRIAGHRGDLATEWDVRVVQGWKALCDALKAVGAYEVILASACQRDLCPDHPALLVRFKAGIEAAKDLVVVG
jgi:hypothetical protein